MSGWDSIKLHTMKGNAVNSIQNSYFSWLQCYWE